MAFDITENLRDRNLEEGGEWMEYDEGVEFLVARKSNAKYKAFVSKKYRENERAVSSKSNPTNAEKISEKIMLEATAFHLLKDWKGIVEGGKTLEFSKENSVRLLEEFEDVRAAIEEFSESRDNFIISSDKKGSENLKK